MNSSDLALAIRRDVLQMTHEGKASHVGSCLSVADILAVLYKDVLRIDPTNSLLPDRDRFILSKGHAAAALYAVLAECGFFPRQTLHTYYQDGSALAGHVTTTMPGVEHSTGSLGHGLSVAAGMALAAKRGRLNWRAIALLSDGECDEGSVWEPAMLAAHHKLSNLVAIIDYNKYQSLDLVENTLRLEPFGAKWEAFGWHVEEVDGHNHAELRAVLSRDHRAAGKPTCVIAHTVKGKGVSFMESNVLWHYRPPDDDELARAMAELSPMP